MSYRNGNRFYTGKECINGHLSERWVSNGNCIECREAERSETIGLHSIKLFIIQNPGWNTADVSKILGFSKAYIGHVFKLLNIPRGSRPGDCVG